MSMEKEFEQAWEQNKLERYNLAVLGATGVGKSTLINAVFGGDLARTGVGKPVTQHVSLYKNDEGTLGLYDFKGSESFDEMRGFVQNFKNIYRERVDEGEPIHGVWFCVKASDRRFDDAQRKLLDEINDLGVPVILVVTQTPFKPDIGFPPDVVEFLRFLADADLPIVSKEPIPVAAVDDHFLGTKAHGLDRLVEVSITAAPKGVAPALVAAQRIDLERKRSEANGAITLATVTATGIGATPIPMTDAALLAPVQLGMMRKVASIYGIPLTKDAGVTIATQLTVAAAGKAAATSLLKLVPGFGVVITGTIAGTFTAAVGYAWRAICELDYQEKLNLADMFEEGSVVDTMLGLVRENLTNLGKQ